MSTVDLSRFNFTGGENAAPIQDLTALPAQDRERLVLAGIDVQHTMAFGDEQEVKDELHRLTSAFDRPEGGLMLTFGNGNTPDWRYDNLKTLLEESFAL